MELSSPAVRRADLRGGLDTRPAPPPKPKRKRKRSRPAIAPDVHLARCECAKCKAGKSIAGGSWPKPYTGLVSDSPTGPRRRQSWECWLEENPVELGEDAQRRGIGGLKMIEQGQAVAEGLTIHRRRAPQPVQIMRGECERCGGIKPQADRFCVRCFRIVKAEIEAGCCVWPRVD